MEILNKTKLFHKTKAAFRFIFDNIFYEVNQTFLLTSGNWKSINDEN